MLRRNDGILCANVLNLLRCSDLDDIVLRGLVSGLLDGPHPHADVGFADDVRDGPPCVHGGVRRCSGNLRFVVPELFDVFELLAMQRVFDVQRELRAVVRLFIVRHGL